MSLALHVGRESFEVGAASFLKSFFSTVFMRLENGNWASRYPVIMNGLYAGRLPAEQCQEALEELKAMREGLRAFPASAAVWDFELPEALPPWGTEISATVTSLANYFVTSSGRELLTVFEAAVAEALVRRIPVTVE